MKPVARLLSLLLALGLLNGCAWIGSWFDDEEDPNEPAPLVEFEPSVEVRKVWDVQIGDGLDRRGRQLWPAYSRGTLYAGDHEGRLYAIESETGRVRWSVKTELPFSGGPGVSDERVYVGTIDGEVLAFDRENGDVLWRGVVSSEVLSTPVEAGGVVVVRSIDGRVFGLSVDDGTRSWIYDHAVPLLTLRGSGPPLARAGAVFIGYDNGEVVALRASDGTQLWEQAIISPEGRTELERLADVDGPMALVASDLIAASYRGRVAALAAQSGQLLWFKDIASSTGVSVDRTNLAVSDRDGALWVLDRRNGSELWKQDQLARRRLTLPVFYGSLVVVGDHEGYLHFYALEDGRLVARVEPGGDGIAAPPLVVGNLLYVFTHDGDLVAYRAGGD